MGTVDFSAVCAEVFNPLTFPFVRFAHYSTLSVLNPDLSSNFFFVLPSFAWSPDSVSMVSVFSKSFIKILNRTEFCDRSLITHDTNQSVSFSGSYCLTSYTGNLTDHTFYSQVYNGKFWQIPRKSGYIKFPRPTAIGFPPKKKVIECPTGHSINKGKRNFRDY